MPTTEKKDGEETTFVDHYCAGISDQVGELMRDMLPRLRDGISKQEFAKLFGERQMFPGFTGSDFIELLQLDGVLVLRKGKWKLVPPGTDTYERDDRFPKD